MVDKVIMFYWEYLLEYKSYTDLLKGEEVFLMFI